jgi:phosphohistidine phosphatase
VLPTLYHATSAKLLEIICSIEAVHSSALVIGHNPGMHEIASRLTDRVEVGDQSPSILSSYPTAALAVLTFDIDAWSEVDLSQGTLIDFMVPKRLPKPVKN